MKSGSSHVPTVQNLGLLVLCWVFILTTQLVFEGCETKWDIRNEHGTLKFLEAFLPLDVTNSLTGKHI